MDQTYDWLRLLRFPTTTQFQRFQGFHGFQLPTSTAPVRAMAPSTWKVGANWNQNPVDGKNPAPVDRWFIFIHLSPNISKVSTIQGGAGLLGISSIHSILNYCTL